MNIKTKWLYVDFSMPQVPIGNRTRLGAMPLSVTPLHGAMVIYGDSAGGDTLLTVSDQVAVNLYYTQFAEDSAPGDGPLPHQREVGGGVRHRRDAAAEAPRGAGSASAAGLWLYGGPFNLNNMTGNSGPFKNVINATQNIANESRYYMGFDSRYRIGNTSIEPTFMYLLGTRNYTGASRAQTGVGKSDFNAFVGNLIVSHQWGPWLFQGRVNYTSGNRANDDVNNTGIGSRADVKYYAPMNADGGPFWQEWFEIFGNSEVDGTSIDTYRRMSESGGLDRFGWQNLAAAVEYQLRDNLILEGAAGGFWSAQKTGCPSNLREGSISGPCGGLRELKGEPTFNFTGNSRYLGWEVAAGIRYTVLPGLTWTPRLAYADFGSGLNQNGRKAMDAWLFANRMIYVF